MTLPKAVLREKRIAELEGMDEIQDRIDRVAYDLSTGKHRYAVIDAWALGELLDVDFDDTGAWSRFCYVYRHELEDAGFDHPFAENIELLRGRVPPSRYARLSAMAEEVEGDDKDLPLNKKEIALIRDAYVDAHRHGWTNGIDVCMTTLKSTDGVDLDFQVCIDDSGESFDAKSPYDLKQGRGFDPSGFLELE